MRKMPAVALIVLTALAIGGAAPLLLRAQTGGPVRPGAGAAAVDDFPRRTTREFAPFIRALLQRRVTNAQQIFRMRRGVLNSLDNMDYVRILSRFQKPGRFDLNLVGGRILGRNIGILLFTIANEEGPVFFKIYYYDFADQRYIDRIDISDDWTELETAVTTVEMLPTPITVSLSATDDGG
jgi:hypothetical protein